MKYQKYSESEALRTWNLGGSSLLKELNGAFEDGLTE